MTLVLFYIPFSSVLVLVLIQPKYYWLQLKTVNLKSQIAAQRINILRLSNFLKQLVIVVIIK